MQQLELRLLGFPEFRFDGQPVKLSLRKAAALIIFLAEAGGPVSREVAATLLWPETEEETARARLRRTLDKIRLAFGGKIIAADAATLSLLWPLSVAIDSKLFENACNEGSFQKAIDIYCGEYLAGFTLPDCPAFDEWVFYRREALRSRLVQALERLIDASMAREPRVAVLHATRLLGLDPLSESAHRHLIRAYIAVGDRVAAERQLASCTQLLREELDVAPDPQTLVLLQEASRDGTATMPETRYVEVDGIHLAFQTLGDGPCDIMLVPGFVSHVERIWDYDRCRDWLSTVSGMGRLIIFDRRGMGLSDRVGARPTVEATAQDILAVLDAVGSTRVLLIGASEGGPGCIRFAVDHPDRLKGLILWGSMAKGSASADYPFALTSAQYDLWKKRLIAKWGGPAEIETFAPELAHDRHARTWWASLLRAASSPGAVSGILDALRDTDVCNLLDRISVPTTVVHRMGDQAVHVEAGRFLAERIHGAKLIEIVGTSHWFWAGDQRPMFDAIGAALANGGRRSASK